jgi:DNA invertase Pin-like site-specific DNA recombinase
MAKLRNFGRNQIGMLADFPPESLPDSARIRIVPTARKQGAEKKRLLAEGMPKLEVAKELGIGKSSLYRIAAEQAA